MDWLDSENSDVEKDSFDTNHIIVKKNSTTSTDEQLYAKNISESRLQDTFSITNSLQDLQLDEKQLTKKTSFNMENCEEVPHIVADEDGNFKTHEKLTQNVFMVSEEMLVYRGKRYSTTDIAQLWKKDCRTWLWKTTMKKRKPTKENVEDLRKRSKTTLT